MVPETLHIGLYDLQLCVPREGTDQQIEKFANDYHLLPEGLYWKLLPDGHEHLDGDPQYNQCGMYKNKVHVKLEC